MSEVVSGRIASQSIRFVSRRVALVDATQTQYGSLIISRTVPLVVMMRKVRAGWRITELRMIGMPAYP